MQPKIISAIGTPLTDDEQLHAEGLELQLADHWNYGIHGILVGGTMGAMQLLTNDTYEQLVRRSIELWAGHGEILVGAGDAGFARSRDRIEFLNQFAIDGVAILTPYFWGFSQEELITYYKALADVSKAPIYLYDLPALTGTKITMETMAELAKHPNIAGAKVSCDAPFQRALVDELGDSFRVIVAQPELVDMMMHHGIPEHLDGVWSIHPGWIMALARHAADGDWDKAAEIQRSITKLRNLIVQRGFSVYTNFMNARGIPGRFAPLPFKPLTQVEHEALLKEPIVAKFIAENPLKAG